MAFHRIETLSDLIREGLRLKVTCRCGRSVVLPAFETRTYCFKRAIYIDFETIQRHLRCMACKERGKAKVEPCA